MYPKRIKEFVPWTKAMIQGATVDKPEYGKSRTRKFKTRKRRRKRKKKRLADG